MDHPKFPLDTPAMAKKRKASPEEVAQAAALKAHQVETLRYVKSWLKYRGLLQKHIANALNVSEGAVSRYLSGKLPMNVGHLRQIAFLLKASEGDILRPPPTEGLGPDIEETLAEMARLGPEKWRKVLAAVKEMRGKSED